MKPDLYFRFGFPFGLGFFVDRPRRTLLENMQPGPAALDWKLAIGPLFFAGTIYLQNIAAQPTARTEPRIHP